MDHLVEHGAIAWGAHPERAGVIDTLKAHRDYVILSEDRIGAGGTPDALAPCLCILAVNSCAVFELSEWYPQHRLLAMIAYEHDGWLRNAAGGPCITRFGTRLLDIRNEHVRRAWIETTRALVERTGVPGLFVDECYTDQYIGNRWGIDGTGWTEAMRVMLLRVCTAVPGWGVMVNSSDDFPAFASISGWFAELQAEYGPDRAREWLRRKFLELPASRRKLLLRAPVAESVYWQGVATEFPGTAVMEYHGDYGLHPVRNVIGDGLSIAVDDESRCAEVFR